MTGWLPKRVKMLTIARDKLGDWFRDQFELLAEDGLLRGLPDEQRKNLYRLALQALLESQDNEPDTSIEVMVRSTAANFWLLVPHNPLRKSQIVSRQPIDIPDRDIFSGNIGAAEVGGMLFSTTGPKHAVLQEGVQAM